MPTKFVYVSFRKVETTYVYAQVETDLSGDALEDTVAVPNKWMREYFGDDWENWEIEDVTDQTDELLTARHTNYVLDNELNQAPQFKIAQGESVTNSTPPSNESISLSEDEFEKLYPLIENHLNLSTRRALSRKIQTGNQRSKSDFIAQVDRDAHRDESK